MTLNFCILRCLLAAAYTTDVACDGTAPTDTKTSIITSLRQEVMHGGCKQRRIRRFITIPRFLKPTPASLCFDVTGILGEFQVTEHIVLFGLTNLPNPSPMLAACENYSDFLGNWAASYSPVNCSYRIGCHKKLEWFGIGLRGPMTMATPWPARQARA